ncbi:MAG: transketolase [Bacteroidetes bacterium]|nr:transketolase [Bacteroidota bacterium]
MANVTELKKIATQVRRDIIRMTNSAESGHPGGSLGCADFITALYFEVMDYSTPFEMNGLGEDIFFLSNGHISPLFYSVLARAGFFEISELATFRKLDSRLQGHPATAEGLPGVRVASGSLGQGLSVAVGAALAKKLNGDKSLVYSLHSDGEMQEGQNYEAMMFAVHHKVDNLIATVDLNGQQIDGPTNRVMNLGDIKAKWSAFGWEVLQMNGNVTEEVLDVLNTAKEETGKGRPVVIIMKTVMGWGVDFMEDDYRWHGVAPNDDEMTIALSQLDETLGDY